MSDIDYERGFNDGVLLATAIGWVIAAIVFLGWLA